MQLRSTTKSYRGTRAEDTDEDCERSQTATALAVTFLFFLSSSRITTWWKEWFYESAISRWNVYKGWFMIGRSGRDAGRRPGRTLSGYTLDSRLLSRVALFMRNIRGVPFFSHAPSRTPYVHFVGPGRPQDCIQMFDFCGWSKRHHATKVTTPKRRENALKQKYVWQCTSIDYLWLGYIELPNFIFLASHVPHISDNNNNNKVVSVKMKIF